MSSRKFGLNLVVVLAIAALFTGFWALINRPVSAPNWPEQISGFSYSPFQQGQFPQKDQYPTDDEMRRDLEIMSKLTDNIRIYSVDGSLQDIPKLAEEFGLRVTLGIWISPDQERNEREIQRAIELANTSRSVVRVVVGNEAIFRKEITAEQLSVLLDRVRAAVKVPVTTSEQWHVWEEHPELAKHVDLIAAHVLPYWEFIPVDKAGQFVFDRARDLKKLFPKKPLLLSEVGWPSNGRMRGGADASPADQAIYLRTLVNKLNRQGFNYFVIEAFDQPWKASDEGSVGAYWGVFNAARQQKFNFEGPVVAIPQWRVLAIGSVVLALLSLTLLMIDGSALRQRGRTFLTFIAFLCGSVLVWIGYDYSQQYSTWFSLTVGFLLALGALGVFIVLLTEAHELAEAVWIHKRRREFLPVIGDSDYRPKVSIHVPCYNEPPDMVKQTLDALAALDYPDYEVLIIDNNTKDPAVWEPVRDYCETLGPRFKFFHVSPLAGFKGGALNYLIPHTAKDAEVIAVIDSDYCVHPNWLKHMVPHFADPKIAVVQSPQDYRDQNESTFKKLCYAEYKGFFHIGMVTRNDRDAIIQHGTMTMTRRSVLEELGWADWCICEDAELGLRVFEKRPVGGVLPRQLRQGPDAGYLHRLQETAFPLGLRRDPDHQTPHRQPVARQGHRADPWSALPLPCGLVAVGRGRHEHLLHRRRAVVVGGDDHRAATGRSAAADFRDPAVGAVRVQGRQDHLPVPSRRRREPQGCVLRGAGRAGVVAHYRQSGAVRLLHQQHSVLPHAEKRRQPWLLGGDFRSAGRAVHHVAAVGRGAGDLPGARHSEQRHALLGGDAAGAVAALRRGADHGVPLVATETFGGA
ncbi:exo-beta-1,3-glucanase (GH17 family) [Pseudomonas monsensis]